MAKNYLLEFYEVVTEIQSNSDSLYIQEYINECGGVLTESQAIDAYNLLLESVGSDVAQINKAYKLTVAAANAKVAAARQLGNPDVIKMAKISRDAMIADAKELKKKSLKNVKGLFKRTRGAIHNAKGVDVKAKFRSAKEKASGGYKASKDYVKNAGTTVSTKAGKFGHDAAAFAARHPKMMKGGKIGAGVAAAGAVGGGVYKYAKKRKSEK